MARAALGAAVSGSGRAGEVVGEWGGSIMAQWRRRTGAGSRGGGTAVRVAARPVAARGRGARAGGRRRPDVWAPHVSGSEREREGRRARSGPPWAESGLGRGVGLGVRMVLFFFSFSFFLFFSNPFQTNFKPFKFKFFTCFQIQILTQILQIF
jgi:hypothetical protein